MEIDRDGIEIKKIKEFIKLKNKKALEIGCGNGRLSFLLSKEVKKLIAIDSDKKSIEKAKLKIKNVDFRICSGEDLPFPDDAFDVVFLYFLFIIKTAKKL